MTELTLGSFTGLPVQSSDYTLCLTQVFGQEQNKMTNEHWQSISFESAFLSVQQ